MTGGAFGRGLERNSTGSTGYAGALTWEYPPALSRPAESDPSVDSTPLVRRHKAISKPSFGQRLKGKPERGPGREQLG